MEKITKVDTYRVDLKCTVCLEGDMQYLKESWGDVNLTYLHACDRCHETGLSDRAYPYIEHINQYSASGVE